MASENSWDGEEYPADTLGMQPAEMRRLGYRVVDLVVDRLCNRNREPAIRVGDFQELMRHVGGPLPEEPMDPEAAIELLAEVALAHQQHGDHPRYFARVPGPSSFAAVLGEWLGTGFNTIAASWVGGSGPATVELVVTQWLAELLGMPAETEGVLVSGGSMANLTAIAAVREVKGHGVAYTSDQTHSSIHRGLRVLGFPEGSIRVLPSDETHRLPADELRAAIRADQRSESKPLIVIATAGTTNTGAVDPLSDIADICASHDVWLHIDGAYGAPGALCDAGKAALQGIERADSLVLDPHKWLFQPYDVGCLLVRRAGILAQAFSMNPEYLKDVVAARGEVDFRNRGIELTRRSRAIKLWLTFRTYGVPRIRAAIQRGIELAESAEAYLLEDQDTWEVVTSAKLGIVTFALRGRSPAAHIARVKRLAASGFATISSTVIKGRTVFRLCTINPLTTREDLQGTIDRLARPSATDTDQ